MPILIVDRNEQSTNPKVVADLKKNFGSVVVTDLPHREYGGTNVTAGDINIPLDDGSILAIERKTPNDFLNSIKDRHIFNQVEVMSQNAKYYAVIITGKMTWGGDGFVYIDNKKEPTGWKSRDVRGVRRSLMLAGCIVEDCPANEYAAIINEIYTSCNQPDKRQAIFKNKIISYPPIDERVQFLAQLPGVGLELAESLLCFAGQMTNEHDQDGFGSLADAFEWVSIMSQIDKGSRPKGWGPNKVLTIRKFFGLASHEYIKKASANGEQLTTNEE